MVEIYCLDDVPSRVLELLKIFLAASSRGERAELVLEPRSKSLTAKYRSVDDDVVGVSAQAGNFHEEEVRRKGKEGTTTDVGQPIS